ncbi:MAG: hypothetical protein NC203_06940 [Firmicutes bacterium]|nr:hypothetical protein [[Eubacterium] siraeum]MCM1488084.1 hypothetical protein [Bacillota bacterium]
MAASVVFDVPERLVSAAIATHNNHKVCVNSVCGDTSIAESNVCEHGEEAWTRCGNLQTLTNAATNGGSYYLDDDITLTDSMTIKSGITLNLCLNGHTITMSSTRTPLFQVKDGGTLNLCDCKGGGQLTGAKETQYIGGAVYARGIFNMYSGAITGNSGMYGGVCVPSDNNGTFNMYGGTISGNYASDTTKGSAVNFMGDKFEMYGGTITENNTAHAIDGTSLTIYGGEITNNNGTGISSSGNFEMYGGKISGNKGDSYGGVYIFNRNATFSMYGGEIS